MNKIFTTFNIALVAFTFFIASNSKAQTCSASFSYNIGASGSVTFASTSVLNSSFTNVFWNFGPGTFSGTIAGGAGNTIYTYSANGTYTVSLSISSATPFCNSTATAVITITNSTGCGLVANGFGGVGPNGMMNFTNTSTGTIVSTTYTWSFGNGNTSTLTNPSNQYTANGTYTVTLNASNSATCNSTKTLMVNVTNICNLNATFTLTNNANGNVQLFGNGGGSTYNYTIYWGTGNNGTGVGGASTFTQQYNYNNGTYTVTLVVANSSIAPTCTSIASSVITVTNAPLCNLTVNFSSSQGSNGLVNFNNTSTGTVSGVTYTWNFGNGASSNATNPSNTYTANGTYIVTLTANNNMSIACSGVITKTVTVSTICNLNAGFNTSIGNNGTATFSNTTSGTINPTFYNWTFGDGGTSSQANPSHFYTSNGTFTVKLTANTSSAIPNCTSAVQSIITITNACIANANFTLVPSGTPKLWFAIPSSTANISGATWYWGDGSLSNTMLTSHQYSVAGMYSICLSVLVNCGNSAISCNSYSIFRGGAGDNEIIQINVISQEEYDVLGLREEKSLDGKVTVYPNPNEGVFTLQSSVNARVTLQDALGRLILSKDIESGKTEINLGKTEKGIYFLNIQSANGIKVLKIVRE